MDAYEYLSVLNKEQREAVVHSGSPLLILAGAGSGKTRVITTKIAYMISELGINPYSILAVTFTKKAANEMQERAVLLEPQAVKSQIRTFHSFGSWFLRRYAEEAGIDNNFTVYDDDDMVSLLLKEFPEMNRQQAGGVAHKISRAKDYCLLPEDEDKFSLYNLDLTKEVYERYQNRLRQTGNVDFGDLIMLPVLLLKQNEKIRADIHSRFKVVMVDEYQDSNVAQFALLEQLAGPETYICVVGDDDQSIYKFRGAEVENILTFQDHFAGTQIIKLETNYRSVPPVLALANSVIKNNKNRLGKSLIPFRSGEKKAVLSFLSNQDDEVEYVCNLIQKSHREGVPYADWAVLYRTNAQSLGFETEFLHKKIPYSVVGTLKFYQREEIKDALSFLSFLSNPKDEVAFSRIVNKPSRGIGEVRQDKILETYKNNANATLLEKYSLVDACLDTVSSFPAKAKTGLNSFIQVVQNLQTIMLQENSANGEDKTLVEQLAEVSLKSDSSSLQGDLETQVISDSFKSTKRLSELVEKMIKDSGFQEYYENQDEISHTQKVNNLQELINSASLYSLSFQGLSDFLDHIELDRTLELADEEEENPDRVTLITVHNTKGLEFPRVVLTGMENGLFPRGDKDEDEIEEERRLFYVGITRAKDELYFTSCGFRRMYGHTEVSQPSSFLLELDRKNVVFNGNVPIAFRSEKSSVGKSFNQSTMEGRWKRGVKIYHDDYGYGYIMATDDTGDEYLIAVQFESGMVKRFMPRYQSNRLTIIND